ncbi:GNAT family N-acetyltransferase [Streptomyces sp. S.PB5]|uniref:GNAT family N-acetyltransferase n=1 Tax=Streptomyces sp. S.PB5 TaxID=3020844 RepID=UPI0025B0F1A8|nr:GNAT family N-acetyltransferase [Streptomyces sp. S.PB5]MDN3028540.1 GNAT family N-acetyltransferase [Streptomyces sp. S.PB5]
MESTSAVAASLTRVTANFRQYLVGWGLQDRTEGDVEVFRSGLAQPQFNGVVRLRSLDGAEEAMATARERLAGVPWWWWVGPDSPAGTAEALTGLGAVPLGPVPLMTRSLDRVDSGEEPSPEVKVEEIGHGARLTELVRTYSASMGVSPDLEAQVVEAEESRPDNADIVRLAAVVDGQVVGTTVVIMAHQVAGLFIVHVAASHRRRGIGGALTQAALRAGQERGMRLAALGASAMGEPLYRRFGFETVSHYHLFSGPA